MELGPLPPGNDFTAGFLLGPWLVGLCADLYLQGVLSVQMLNYFLWYGKNDRATIQTLVGVLALITTLKSIQSFAIVWVGLIKNFADIESARQHLFGAWYEAGNPLMVALISFYVQCYFCYRLWAVSERWWVVLPIVMVCIFAIIAAILTVQRIVHFQPDLPYWMSAHFATVFVADVLLAATTTFFLVKTRRNVMPQTVGMINALVRLTFQTAMPAVVCALLTLICVYLPPDKPRVANTFNQALPKLYAISMMWTLNARKDIRIFYYGDSISRTESRRQRPTITGSYSIQVGTRTEVLQISDVDTGTDATMRKAEIEDGDSYIRKE
ncbi:hypothetical protein EDD18DRAFT_1144412 [Armillaria luteobubalina]|uniref:DUF6534 domain-containing protein n=1 Tax=Armillaria luteobubalina TaxID=153913 RepID=A0AA39USX9_9AGAR|nr:hypothetical protein EDD18DRAFT_1144412 [Armillaria luteobubalina]